MEKTTEKGKENGRKMARNARPEDEDERDNDDNDNDDKEEE